MDTKYILSILVILFISCSCNDETNIHRPIDTDPAVPDQVTNIQVENIPGGAVITYDVPKDRHLLFVKAVYTMSNGKANEVRASYYSDTLRVLGFSDTLQHRIELFSVSRSGVSSEAETVDIKPYEAPITKVFKSLQVTNDFGGFDISAVNDSGSDIAVIVLTKNNLGEYTKNDDMSIYTSQDSILSKERGLDTTSFTLGLYVMDHWGNVTDTTYKVISPLFDEQLDPSGFSEYTLPGDALENPNTLGIPGLWDGNFEWPDVSFTWADPNQPADIKGKPHMITFNLGVKARLSRIWIRPYPESGERFYFFTAMRTFQIYGSEKPSLSGALDATWDLLGTYTVKKPSGLPYGVHNQEDVEHAEAGYTFDFPIGAPKVQYLRIRCLQNFGGGNQQSISELKVYGDPR